jgi:hypothetical protein
MTRYPADLSGFAYSQDAVCKMLHEVHEHYVKEASIRSNPPSPQWMPIQGTTLAVRMCALDELTAYKNHGQNLAELANRGGMSPTEAVALAKKLPLTYVRSLPAVSETERNRKAVITLSEHGHRAEEPKP